jgi:hypothetical protein
MAVLPVACRKLEELILFEVSAAVVVVEYESLSPQALNAVAVIRAKIILAGCVKGFISNGLYFWNFYLNILLTEQLTE